MCLTIDSFPSSYDNSQLCSCSSDKTVILWDVATGQVTRKLRGHAGVRENNTTIFSCVTEREMELVLEKEGRGKEAGRRGQVGQNKI